MTVYAVPLVSPVTSQVVEGANAMQVLDDGETKTEYELMLKPPAVTLSAIAAHDMRRPPLRAVTAISFGAGGATHGIDALDNKEEALFPAALVATTENLYSVPFSKPVTVQDVVVTVQVNDPGVEVTV